MKNIQLFEKAADYVATEDVQVSYLIDTDEVKYHKKAAIISQLNISAKADVFLGMELVFDGEWIGDGDPRLAEIGIVSDGSGIVTGTISSEHTYVFTMAAEGGNGGSYRTTERVGPVAVYGDGSTSLEITINNPTADVKVVSFCDYYTESGD